MKYIVIGLGYFGFSLSEKLTRLGHEVIGVDKDEHKVEEYKSSITNVICLDATETNALKMLPLKEADAVMVVIGEDFGASILAVAQLKQLGVKRIIARSISNVHKTILDAIGVDRIVMPETYAADQIALDIEFMGVIGSYALDDEYRTIEIIVPDILTGQTLEKVNMGDNFNLKLIAIKRPVDDLANSLTKEQKYKIIDEINNDLVLLKGDQLLLFGKMKEFQKFRKLY